MSVPGSRHVSSPLVLSYKGASPDEELLDWVAEGVVSGVVLFRDNCVDESLLTESISKLRSTSPNPLHIMIDEEGGRVRRLPDAPTSMQDLRAYESQSPDDVAQKYSSVAARLRSLGVDSLLAPVVDIGHDGADWLNSRTISHDKVQVSNMASAVILAIQALGVHACAKHFPGTGRVTLDPHHGPVTCSITKSEWQAHERVPFDAAIAAGVDMILVGHQIMTGFSETLPACMTSAIPINLLRRELGFGGLILTDDLGMGAVAKMYPIEEAVDRCLKAGCDLVLICNDRDIQQRAVAHWLKQHSIS